jgi:hypothetical protein
MNGSIGQSVTLHQAQKANQGQTLKLIGLIHNFRREESGCEYDPESVVDVLTEDVAL